MCELPCSVLAIALAIPVDLGYLGFNYDTSIVAFRAQQPPACQVLSPTNNGHAVRLGFPRWPCTGGVPRKHHNFHAGKCPGSPGPMTAVIRYPGGAGLSQSVPWFIVSYSVCRCLSVNHVDNLRVVPFGRFRCSF